MKEFNYKITDPVGIHARPAGQLVKVANQFDSEIVISSGTKRVDAKKILAVMTLGVRFGQEIKVTISGADEAAALEKISAFLKENL
ncbi:MAG: HPr family phosphocarrier protein [Candidatus Ancillula trichonymphae]|jgi:phosphocarrier protein|nr:HPr family phosphocarrier protein [Candidatus Ancillula trichonymphae]